jgi:hypothetical protein
VFCGVIGFEGSSGINGSPNLDNAVGEERFDISLAICLDRRSFLR